MLFLEVYSLNRCFVSLNFLKLLKGGFKMLESKRKITLGVVLTFSLIISSTSYAGVHFVELPDSITDEMMLNQTPDISLVFA